MTELRCHFHASLGHRKYFLSELNFSKMHFSVKNIFFMRFFSVFPQTRYFWRWENYSRTAQRASVSKSFRATNPIERNCRVLSWAGNQITNRLKNKQRLPKTLKQFLTSLAWSSHKVPRKSRPIRRFGKSLKMERCSQTHWTLWLDPHPVRRQNAINLMS